MHGLLRGCFVLVACRNPKCGLTRMRNSKNVPMRVSSSCSPTTETWSPLGNSSVTSRGEVRTLEMRIFKTLCRCDVWNCPWVKPHVVQSTLGPRFVRLEGLLMMQLDYCTVVSFGNHKFRWTRNNICQIRFCSAVNAQIVRFNWYQIVLLHFLM